MHLSSFCNSFSCLVTARFIVPEWDIYGWGRKHVSIFRSVDVGGLHKSISYNWKLLFHRKMSLRSHSVTWDDFYTTFVTRNWAESFPKTLFSLRMLSFRYVLYSGILINVEKCPMQCEASSELIGILFRHLWLSYAHEEVPKEELDSFFRKIEIFSTPTFNSLAVCVLCAMSSVLTSFAQYRLLFSHRRHHHYKNKALSLSVDVMETEPKYYSSFRVPIGKKLFTCSRFHTTGFLSLWLA